MRDDIKAAEAEIARLKELLKRDQTGLAEALVEVRKLAKGWLWLGEADGWGSYDWPERTIETLRAEMGRCLNAVHAAASTALRQSGTRVTEGLYGDRPLDVRPPGPPDAPPKAPPEIDHLRPVLYAAAEALGVSRSSYWWRYATAMPSVLGLVRWRLDVARLVLPRAWPRQSDEDVEEAMRLFEKRARNDLAREVGHGSRPPLLAGNRALAVFYAGPDDTGDFTIEERACAGPDEALAFIGVSVDGGLDRLGGYAVIDLDSGKWFSVGLGGLISALVE